jgi:uncharacterized protein
MEEKIVYFEEPGMDNTVKTLQLAAERAKARGISKIILASTRGDTARLAAESLAGTNIKLVVVPHQYGFGERQRFPGELVSELENQGHQVYFGTMLFHTDSLVGNNTPAVLATLLRTFCQGMKVCLEIIMMVTDGGCVALGESVIAVSGTGRGADTAVVATASSSNRLSDLHVTEIICKPLETKSWPVGTLPPRP